LVMRTSPSKSQLLDFVRELDTLPDNQRYGNLQGKVAIDLGVREPELPASILQAGATRCYVTGQPAYNSIDDRVVKLDVEGLVDALPRTDVAFFDARCQPGFDHVNGVRTLVEQLRRTLSPDGYAFAILKTGFVMQGFDVSNPIVATANEVLPSPEYLFRDLLADCTVRTLGWPPASGRYETVRLFRLSIKRPTLLLILGRSHSGKTSLARDFQSVDEHMHVSNDYIYTEIVTKQRDGLVPEFARELAEMAGDGSGKACGAFNRALESSPDLLVTYVRWLIALIPRHKRLVSMDLDLIDPGQVSLMKQMLADAGFSVWLVMR